MAIRCIILLFIRTNYHFKMCLSLASLGMSSIIKEDVRVMEIWIDGHPEKYRLEAKNKKLKEEFAAELKKGILKAKENPSTSRIARQPQAVQVKYSIKRKKKSFMILVFLGWEYYIQLRLWTKKRSTQLQQIQVTGPWSSEKVWQTTIIRHWCWRRQCWECQTRPGALSNAQWSDTIQVRMSLWKNFYNKNFGIFTKQFLEAAVKHN